MVKVAVVGCGYWGPNLVRSFQQVKDCTLAACCDMVPERLSPIQKLYPTVHMTTNYQEILEDPEIDAVALATPARTHNALGKQALEHGKHLLVEKPLAMTSNECQELIDVAAQAKKVLMVGHTFLYNPALRKVKELTTPEHLGEMFYLYSHRVNLGRVQTDINALWSIAPHDISIALYLTDQMPVEVSAKGASYLTNQVEDVVFLTLLFPSGLLTHIHVSWIDPSKVRRVTVVGSKRMIVFDDLADEGKVKVYDKGVLKQNGPVYGGFHYRLHSGDIYAPKVDMVEPLIVECSHFVESIKEGRQPLSDGRNGLQVVQILEAAQQSLQSHGAPVKIPLEGMVTAKTHSLEETSHLAANRR